MRALNVIYDTLKNLRDRFVFDLTDTARNVSCTAFVTDTVASVPVKYQVMSIATGLPGMTLLVNT